MTRTAMADTITIKKRDLRAMLRQVVREELDRFIDAQENWDIEEGSVLWQDLRELRKGIREGSLKLYSRKEDMRE